MKSTTVSYGRVTLSRFLNTMVTRWVSFENRTKFLPMAPDEGNNHFERPMDVRCPPKATRSFSMDTRCKPEGDTEGIRSLRYYIRWKHGDNTMDTR